MGLRDLPQFSELESNERNISTYDSNQQLRTGRQFYFIVEENTDFYERGYRFTSQFTPQQIRRNVSSNIPESGGFSREAPIIQWVSGKVETMEFQVRLFSEHRDDHTTEAKLNVLETLAKKDRILGRPPILRFFWGVVVVGFRCQIESLGGISYDETRSDGTPRGATLEMVLKKWVPYHIEQQSFTPLEQTPATIAKDGETYEMIAKRVYGDPMIGVLLRRLNPRFPIEPDSPKGVADLSSGNRVKLFTKEELASQSYRPQCHVLRMDDQIAFDNRRRFFNLRSREIAILPGK